MVFLGNFNCSPAVHVNAREREQTREFPRENGDTFSQIDAFFNQRLSEQFSA